MTALKHIKNFDFEGSKSDYRDALENLLRLNSAVFDGQNVGYIEMSNGSIVSEEEILNTLWDDIKIIVTSGAKKFNAPNLVLDSIVDNYAKRRELDSWWFEIEKK